MGRGERRYQKPDDTGRKIGMYLHSNEPEKFEIGKCIRKKFDGMAYDGEIVSINLDTKFYHILGTLTRMRKTPLYHMYKDFGFPKRSTKRKEVVKTTNNEEIKMYRYSTLTPKLIHWKQK